jgi:hypothetical protein
LRRFRLLFQQSLVVEEQRMSDRVLDVLMIRCGERREGWVFPEGPLLSALLKTACPV